MYSSDELFQRSREGYFWCFFPELRSNEGNKHQNTTQVSAETVRHDSTYIVLFLTRHNESIYEDKNDDLCTLSPCPTLSFFVLLMTSQSVADDVTMTRQLWRVMWIVISNSLDIDFIHSDIHDWSCKKVSLLQWYNKNTQMAWVDNNNSYITLTQVDTREQTVSCNALSTNFTGASLTDVAVAGCNRWTVYSAFDFHLGF